MKKDSQRYLTQIVNISSSSANYKCYVQINTFTN